MQLRTDPVLIEVLSGWSCCTVLGLTPVNLRVHSTETLFAIDTDWASAAGVGSTTPEGPVTSTHV